jgi:(1->4)-alpha-D-glucan 1-alpha-D-glucosylmutase
MIPPRATYRLQLNKDFTFADALALVPYLDELGISHAYLSPILKAQPGSTHGYDTVDHTQINPEIGSLEDFRALAHALQQRGMGILLDFVPNHMGVGGADNAQWLDVLKFGPASRYADWFDINWHPPRPGMEGKLLIPFLATGYAATLAAGHLHLKADGDGLAVWAYDKHKLPIRPEDARALLARHGSTEPAITAHTGRNGDIASWQILDRLIASQHWRLAHFATGADEINYRRFFITSELAGIRIEHPPVFDHAHALIFSLIEEGLVDGLRIDHIDGLFDPLAYLEKLRARSPRSIYLIVEKILAPHEAIRSEWPVDGTTGYEVGAQLTRVLMHGEEEPAVTAAYAAFVGDVVPFDEEVYRCKLRVMDNELAAELAALARQFAFLAWSVSATADLTEAGLRRALRETIAQLSVYRTYIAGEIHPRDRREVGYAIAAGRRRQPHIQPAVFDFIATLLCGELAPDYDAPAIAAAIGKFQQFTGPVMAKGLEDTALYRYNRLIALNEVGAHPDRFAISIAAFHDSNRRRLETHPHCMVGTTTHDSKRGEDIRAVIASIADEPDTWVAAVREWRKLLSVDGRDPIHPGDLYLFFQLLLGGWPIAGDAADLAGRLNGAMMKSLWEARLRTDWSVNNTAYEAAVSEVIDRAFSSEIFLSSFHAARMRFQEIGRRKALVQAALKLTIPGVPDIYRGAEDWEQSFVDPDNRRFLDFSSLTTRLAAPVPGRDDKLQLTRTLLQLRRRLPRLFAEGTYPPLACGPGVLGFLRQHGDASVAVLADLSPGHDKGIVADTLLPTVFGSKDGPVWVMATDGE